MQKMSMHEGNAREELLYNAIKNASSLARIFSTKLGLPIWCIFVVQTKTTCKYVSFWIIFSVSKYSAAETYLSRCNWYYCLNIKMTYWHALRGFWVSKFKSLVPCLSKKNSPKRLFYRQSCHVFLQLHFAISLCKCQMSIILLFISKMLFDLRNILCT